MRLEAVWGQEGTQQGGSQQLSQEAVVTAKATGDDPLAGVLRSGQIPGAFCRWSQQGSGTDFVLALRERGLRDDS